MSSDGQPAQPSKLVSQLLLEDRDLRDIIEEFVAGLAGRLDELRSAHAKLDFELLTILAHRLKGAAGSYGYPDISQICAQMEPRFRSQDAADFAAFVAQLKDLAAAAQVGLSEGP